MKNDKNSFPGGSRLREERERLGLLQGDAERLFGVSRVTWGKYEREEGEPGANVLTALAAAGADVLYILTGTRGCFRVEEKAAGYGNNNLREDEKELLDNYSACSQEGKIAIMAAATALAIKTKKD